MEASLQGFRGETQGTIIPDVRGHKMSANNYLRIARMDLGKEPVRSLSPQLPYLSSIKPN
jgi:hypothetical protein